MNDRKTIGRRTACAAMLGMGGSLLLANQSPAGEKIKAATKAAMPALKNSDFYDAAGKFNVEAAKDAYLAFCKAVGYPFGKKLRETMWVADFALGRFLEVGLGGNFWINDKKYNYTSLEMFLLPNQMVPEHWHVDWHTESEKYDEHVPAKMESWHVRYGSSYTYGEGPATPKIGVQIHESEKEFITVFNETVLHVGEVTGIKKPLEKHWQQAGPQGAIITESSTYHRGDAVRFTNPNIKF